MKSKLSFMVDVFLQYGSVIVKKIKVLSVLLLILLVYTNCTKEKIDDVVASTIKVEYTSSNLDFGNPERGIASFYDGLMGGDGLSESWLKGEREVYHPEITLLYRCYYMNNFRSSPLPESALESFDTDMEKLRKYGFKLVLRFAYTWDSEPDAPLNIVLMHIEQLKPHLIKNADVIAVMQAGFIGPWGECHSSQNGLDDPAVKAQIFDKILESLPQSRAVQFRRPLFKTEYVNRTNPITAAEAFSGQKFARIGHFNDGFLGSINDVGTYINIEAEKAYLSQDCLYVPIGGEFSATTEFDGYGIFATATTAYNEMRYLHYDFLYGTSATWDQDPTTRDKILREMGYRFELISGEYTNELSPKSSFTASIALKNVGFSALFNERNVELILKNTQTNEIYKAKLNIDPRFWQPETESTIDVTLGIPSDIAIGDYKLYLNMPDIAETIQDNPYFSVRFANENVWESETGYNDLLTTITIKENTHTPIYSGNNFFEK
ncbi:MAG: DUF4832 domain-containing protein [Prevotellaceae bacterium]|jgi:hypothetical protein|nr:DUF4832 domain-containing protein [Prevotellaceae bacterium]